MQWLTVSANVRTDIALGEQIRSGQYDQVSEGFAELFSVQKRPFEMMDLFIVGVTGDMTTDEVHKWLDSQGLQAVSVEHLLAVGTARGDEKIELNDEFRRCSIVALGSIATNGTGKSYVPVLTRYFNGSITEPLRELALREVSDDTTWTIHWFVLASYK